MNFTTLGNCLTPLILIFLVCEMIVITVPAPRVLMSTKGLNPRLLPYQKCLVVVTYSLKIKFLEE